MTLIATLAALALLAAQPPASPATPPTTESAPAPPTIDSLLDQPPIDEDARQAAVRAAYAAAEARRGSLDGRWRLSTPDGQALYIFQFSDPGRSPDPRSISPSVPVVEGAWRDPLRAGAAGSSGFLINVRRDGADLIVRFQDQEPAHPRLVKLHQRPDGVWAGTLESEAEPRPVVMARF